MDEETNQYNSNISDFTRDNQARYLLQLRDGEGERLAARAIGFEPSTVFAFRKENPLFEEECQEALKEAEEVVQKVMRKAALNEEPYALQAFSKKWGWQDKKDGEKNTVNVFNGVALTGNPFERLEAAQKQLFERPDAELPPQIIDVSVDEDPI